jgi:hypothetical protein
MDEYVEVWEFSIIPGGLTSKCPENIVSACRAVGRDLMCRRYGRNLDLEFYTWKVSLLDTGDIHIQLNKGVGRRRKIRDRSISQDFGGVGFGGIRDDQNVSDATASIAEGVQDNLAGYSFVQWPAEEKRLLVPRIILGKAVWVDPRRVENVVAEIGHLCVS